VQCLDVLDDAPAGFRAFYGQSYLFLVRHLSWVWKFSYALLDHDLIYRCVQPFRRAWNLWITRQFKARLIREAPTVVITTHFLAADVCSAGKRSGWLTSRFVVVVTDFHPHWFWVSREPDAMVVSTEASVALLVKRGVARARIHLLGIPIAHTFSEPVDRAALRQRFGLAAERLTILVTSGGTTVGQFERVVQGLVELEAALPGRMQLLVVCGEDRGAKDRLTQHTQAGPMPVKVFGFIDFMAELMGASDLIVAKAGGLTVSEALGRGVPLVLYHIIPGQERSNAEYVARYGAGVIALHPSDVARTVRRLISEPTALEAMRQAARALSRPDSAKAIISNVVEPLLRRDSIVGGQVHVD